jgi:hypothetical protein
MQEANYTEFQQRIRNTPDSRLFFAAKSHIACQTAALDFLLKKIIAKVLVNQGNPLLVLLSAYWLSKVGLVFIMIKIQ